jgi:8-oxo-dGTP pyrophosphatase MutT (NUDIX family)
MMVGPVSERQLQQGLADHLARHQPAEVDDPELLQAAVALIVAPDPLSMLFIRRAARDGDPWSGQMALPGGRMGPEDSDLRATAMRETFEEVAIALRHEDYLGQLDDVAPRTPELPPLMVRPFVFRLPSRITPEPCGLEVAEALWLDVSDFTRPGAYAAATLHLRGRGRVFPGYHLQSGLVWGMTERIITPLLRSLALIP